MMPQDNRQKGDARQRKTNWVLGVYVFIGLAALSVSSKPEIVRLDAIHSYVWTYIVILICALVAARATVFYRQAVLRSSRAFYYDPTILAKPDVLTLLQAIWLLGSGFVAFVCRPTTKEIFPMLMFVLMIVSVGLNTYFSRFWYHGSPEPNSTVGPEALKLAHSAWIIIFQSVCQSLMVGFVAGAIGSLVGKGGGDLVGDGGPSQQPTWKPYLDIFAIVYTLLGAPIVWLLRPINATLAAIRMDLAALPPGKEPSEIPIDGK
jgi:hypothetical protein